MPDWRYPVHLAALTIYYSARNIAGCVAANPDGLIDNFCSCGEKATGLWRTGAPVAGIVRAMQASDSKPGFSLWLYGRYVLSWP